MSDFLQFEDEVINGAPKYNVTDNADGTKSITLANEIVQQGTPINKATLGNIGNILGYNLLNVTQEQRLNQVVNLIEGSYQRDEKIANVENLEFYNRTINNYAIDVYENSGKIAITLSVNWDDRIVEVPPSIKKFKVRTSSTGSNLYLRGSQNKTSWTNYYRLNQDTSYHEIENSYRYYRITSDYTSTTVYLADFIFDSVINKFTYDGIPTINNEILKVYVEYTGTPSDNTLNGKPIDTVLLSGHYYELMFDEPNDRFIAYETRV